MVGERIERILILAKTYPYPSTKYRETSCIAGINEEGRLLRLFPVPFRYLQGEKQFSKWQWITARIRKASKDHRPESHTYLATTVCPELVRCTISRRGQISAAAFAKMDR